MIGLGTLINTATVLVGGTVGIAMGNKIPDRVRTIVVQVIGMLTIGLGLSDLLKTHNMVFPLLGMVFGAVIGEVLRIEDRLEGIGEIIRKRFAKRQDPGPFISGFVTASLLFCIGPLTILGAIQDASGATIGTNPTQLFSVGSAGNYELTITDFCGNSDSSLFLITEPPAIVFVGPQDLCTGIDSEVLVSGGLEPYVFAPSAPAAFFVNAITNSVFGTAGGTYDMTVTDACNQSGVVPFILTVCDTEEPNILLINADEYDNESFIIKGLESFPNSQLRIYNRWGGLMYESLNYSNDNPWNGTDVEDGVYFWIFNRSDGISREGYVHVMHKKP